MFKHGFPPEWSTLKKLIWLVGTGIAGAAAGVWKTVTGTLLHITDALPSPVKELSVAIDSADSVSQVNVTEANANLWRNNWYTECGLTLETDESSTYYGFYKGAMKPFGDAQKKITEFNSDGIGRIKITATFGTTGSSFTFRIFFYYSDGTSEYASNINPATGAKYRTSRTSASGKSVVAYAISTSAGATNTYGRIKDIVVTPYDADSTDYVEPIYNVHNFVLPPQGKNLYDVNRETGGVYVSQSGVYTVSDDSCISDFIPVEPGQTYTFSGIQAASSNTKRIHGYSNEVWQEQITSESVSSSGAFAITFTVPSGVDSIIVSHYSSDTNCQLELGSSATAYEPPNYYSGTLTINGNGNVTFETGGETYQLESITPITLLAGENNIWADCGDTTLTYQAVPQSAFSDEADKGMADYMTLLS